MLTNTSPFDPPRTPFAVSRLHHPRSAPAAGPAGPWGRVTGRRPRTGRAMHTLPSQEERAAAAVYHGYAEARRAVEARRAAGFRDDQIGVFGPNEARGTPLGKHFGLPGDPTHTRWEEGGGIGAAAGGLAGLGLGLAVVTGLMSPLGPVVAGGAIVAVLASLGTGAAVGGVVGALCGLGIPEDEAQWYATELAAGRVVVTVHGTNADKAPDILRAAGGSLRDPSIIGIPGTGLPATAY